MVWQIMSWKESLDWVSSPPEKGGKLVGWTRFWPCMGKIPEQLLSQRKRVGCTCFWPCPWKIPEQLLSQRKVWEVLLDALAKRIKHEDWSSAFSLKMRLWWECGSMQNPTITACYINIFEVISPQFHGWSYPPLHHRMWTLVAEDIPLCITVCEYSWLKISPLHHCMWTLMAEDIPFLHHSMWTLISPFALQCVNMHHSMWTLMAKDIPLCITVCEHLLLKISAFASQHVNTHGWGYPLFAWQYVNTHIPFCITVCGHASQYVNTRG